MLLAGEEQQEGLGCKKGACRGRDGAVPPCYPPQQPLQSRPSSDGPSPPLGLRTVAVSALSRLMRVKRLTGELPAIISRALQVSLKAAGAQCPPRSILLAPSPASLGCPEVVSAQPAG